MCCFQCALLYPDGHRVQVKAKIKLVSRHSRNCRCFGRAAQHVVVRQRKVAYRNRYVGVICDHFRKQKREERKRERERERTLI